MTGQSRSWEDMVGAGGHPTLTNAEARYAAITYLDLGWAVMPGPGLDEDGHCSCVRAAGCGAAGKHAYGGWGNDTRRTMTRSEALSLWADDNERHPVDQVFVIPYLSGLVVADVDNLRAWDLVRGEHDVPDTLRQRSGSGRGEHWLYAFKWDLAGDPPRLRGHLPHHAGEVKFRGIIGTAPCPHPSGGRYEWLNWGTPVAPAPEWLVAEQTDAYGDLRVEAVEAGGWWVRAMARLDMDSARKLAELPPERKGGGRVGATYAVAARLGFWVAAGIVDESDARAALLESAELNGSIAKYGAAELERHIANGLAAGRHSTPRRTT